MKRKYIIHFIVIIIFAFAYFFSLEEIKKNKILKSNQEFQVLYNNYLNDKSNANREKLDEFLKKYLFTNKDNNDYQTETYKKLEEQYIQKSYVYNFLKTSDISLLSDDDKAVYLDIIKKADELIARLKTNYTIKDLESLQNNIDDLLVLQRVLLNDYVSVNKEYIDAKNNKNTKISYNDDCFNNQVISEWKLDYNLSMAYCNSLKLSNCSNDFVKKDNYYLSYSLNNPRQVNNNANNYDYVSYLDNDYKALLKVNNTDDKIHVEVFYKLVSGIKIYKYNVLVTNKDYILSCQIPN